MKICICPNAVELGKAAAQLTARILNEAIEKNGQARLLVSTGSSQFETLQALVAANVDWLKVELFHLDEYIGLEPVHKASFVKYLKERFVDLINIRKFHSVDVSGDIDTKIKQLTSDTRERPIDVALIGIGENTHIAFNDPPADFDTREAYIIVELNDSCNSNRLTRAGLIR